jgi:hypothetical protein
MQLVCRSFQGGEVPDLVTWSEEKIADHMRTHSEFVNQQARAKRAARSGTASPAPSAAGSDHESAGSTSAPLQALHQAPQSPQLSSHSHSHSQSQQQAQSQSQSPSQSQSQQHQHHQGTAHARRLTDAAAPKKRRRSVSATAVVATKRGSRSPNVIPRSPINLPGPISVGAPAMAPATFGGKHFRVVRAAEERVAQQRPLAAIGSRSSSDDEGNDDDDDDDDDGRDARDFEPELGEHSCGDDHTSSTHPRKRRRSTPSAHHHHHHGGGGSSGSFAHGTFAGAAAGIGGRSTPSASYQQRPRGLSLDALSAVIVGDLASHARRDTELSEVEGDVLSALTSLGSSVAR